MAAGWMKLDFSKVFWVGGSPCSGKSTIADKLGKKYSLRVYHADDHFPDHVQRANPNKQPLLAALKKMNWDEIFMRPVNMQVEEVFAIYREESEFILDDLSALIGKEPIIAEGAAFTPENLMPFLQNRSNAVWIVPTPDFQRAHYERREWLQHILNQCRHPEQAYENWMERDAEFARQIIQLTQKKKLNLVVVDGSRTIKEITNKVEWIFFPESNPR
jgi:shikimate kinase